MPAHCTDVLKSELVRGTQGTERKKELEKCMARRLEDVESLG